MKQAGVDAHHRLRSCPAHHPAQTFPASGGRKVTLPELSKACSPSTIPMKSLLGCCRGNALHWVYPAQVPKRSYQIDIIKSALLRNTLVCLPTGLGKTLIAAVLMHNFCRWFPEVTAPLRLLHCLWLKLR